MAQQTAQSVTATPGMVHSFVAKTAVAPEVSAIGDVTTSDASVYMGVGGDADAHRAVGGDSGIYHVRGSDSSG